MFWHPVSEWPAQTGVSRCVLRINQVFHEILPGPRHVFLFCMFHSISCTGRRALRPIDGVSLELQPHGEEPVGKPLTVHHASNSPQITHKRINHQSLVQCSRTLGQHAHAKRAHIFCSRPLCRSRVQHAGNLQRERQPNSLLKPSRPYWHW